MPICLHHFPARKKNLYCGADPSLLLPAVVPSDLKGRGLSPKLVRIWLFADMIQLIPGGGPEGLSFFPFCIRVTQMKIFFFPNKNFSIPSVTSVKAFLCPDPFFLKKKKTNIILEKYESVLPEQ